MAVGDGSTSAWRRGDGVSPCAPSSHQTVPATISALPLMIIAALLTVLLWAETEHADLDFATQYVNYR